MVGPGQAVVSAITREPVNHAEVVTREHRRKFFEEIGEHVARGAAVVAVSAFAPLFGVIDLSKPKDEGVRADTAA